MDQNSNAKNAFENLEAMSLAEADEILAEAGLLEEAVA